MKQILPLAALLFLAGSCTNQGSFEPTEREQRLMKAYASLLMHSDRFGKTRNADSLVLYRIQTDSLLDTYGFTRETFQSEFENLIRTPERIEPLLRSISTDINKQPDA